ncbi:PDDEXK family nuclease [Motilibacter deserti]|uniref:DUF559 domain-containing protein n=1 Tax=Motilibacter deserti TaxID=2714956 RepID=A0ABX0H0C7_9ACTN|nr:hypothetical protein [Motilibacter deserti]NHC15474.1 hypothetical protein [Motilibacter deserti]
MPLDELLALQDDVLTWDQAVDALGLSAVRWRVARGRWQHPARGVLVAHSGPLTTRQERWVDVLSAGRSAVLAGLTAAVEGGLRGYDDDRRWVLVPHGLKRSSTRPGLMVRSSTLLAAEHVQPGASPPRTRIARSLVDSATWGPSDTFARSVLHAGAQQRLVRASDLALVVAARKNTRRRALVAGTIADVAGGAHTLAEAEVPRLCRKAGLPEPGRQVRRKDRDGRVRWLDAAWPEWNLVLEVDGRGHLDISAWWDDMARDNALVLEGQRVLRFPSFMVREQPEVVAAAIEAALIQAGWSRRS